MHPLRYDEAMTEVAEYDPHFAGYVSLVPEEDILAAMSSQAEVSHALLASFDESRSGYRYAEGKWSIREVVGHLADAERVFGYRAMCVARGEQASLPSFNENEYMRLSDYDSWPFRDSVEQWALLRRANILLFRNLGTDAWTRRGTAGGAPISVRALGRIIVGHERHHMNVLREQYGA